MPTVPPWLAFVRARLTPGQRYGLGLTLALGGVGVAFWGFLEIVESWTQREDIYRVDAWASGVAQAASAPTLTSVFEWVTHAGSAPVAIAIVLAVAAALWTHARASSAGLLVASFSAGEGLLYGLKAFFHRARPSIQLVAAHGYSFPSGHSFTAALLYGLLAVLAWRSRWPSGARVAACVALVGLALGVGASRIVLGVHYATDVLGGYALAAGWLAASLAVARLALGPHAPADA